jgi:hypothetical protein
MKTLVARVAPQPASRRRGQLSGLAKALIARFNLFAEVMGAGDAFGFARVVDYRRTAMAKSYAAPSSSALARSS